MSLKEFRKKKNLNQQTMAKKIGVSISYYCKVEKGFQTPSYEFLRKIKKVYPYIDIDELFF